MYITINRILSKNPKEIVKGWIFREITDVELSMYDEIMISTMSIPCFKVSLSIHELQPDELTENFRCVWHELKYYPEELSEFEVTLFDKHGNELAKGLIYEYEEKRDERVVVLRCRSDIGVYLDGETGIDNDVDIIRFNHRGAGAEHEIYVADFTSLCVRWFHILWGRAFKEKEIVLQPNEIRYFFKPIVDELIKVMSRRARGNYTLEIRTVGGSVPTRKELLPQLAQLFNAKFVYVYPHFEVTQFSLYEANPVYIKGYMSNEKWDSTVQAVDGVSFIHSVRLFIGTSNVEVSPNKYNFMEPALENIRDRLAKLIKYRSYHIWGFAEKEEEKMIYSGQTISLDGVKYYVQDIKYDTETLNSKKSFNATCVRFV